MRWNLDDLYTSFDSKEFLADFEAAKKEVADMGEWAAANFASKDNAKEKLEAHINRVNGFKAWQKLMTFTMLSRSVDESDELAKKYSDRLRVIFADMSKPNVLFRAYVCSLPNLDELIAQSDILKEHEFLLKETVERGKYLLSEKEELVMAMMRATGSSAWEDIKNQITSIMKMEVEIEGEKKLLNLTAIRNLAHDANQQTRRNAYFAELKSYEEVNKVAAAALNAVKGEVLTNVKLRGYDSALHMTLVNSRMQEGTLNAMLEAIVDSLPSLRRFFKRKAELLGHKNGLPFYDLFAPTGKVNMSFTYEEAKEFILEHFTTYSKKLGDFTRQAFENDWVDAEVRDGKRGGAFCSNIHAIGQSRIMSNYSNSFSNMKTLAHEFGHAYHGECLKHLPSLKTSYTMPIAETASTFCETIVTNAAIKKADRDQAYAILEAEITGALQVIIDIYSRFVFEKSFFEKRQGGSLSVSEINSLMEEAQKTAYGDGLDPEYLHPYMWINKVHYYYAERNFYNFPYAYGLLFSLGLYAQYLKEGESFVQKYDDLLAATGSATLEQIGDLAGIDVRTKDFWKQSISVIEGKIDEFCNL